MNLPNALAGLLDLYDLCVCDPDDRISVTGAEGAPEFIRLADITDEVIILRKKVRGGPNE